MALSEELRLLSIRVLQNFVRETAGDWSWEQWQRLIQRIRRMGFATITEEHIRGLCGRNCTRWLSGDNSVEPPPVPAVEPVEPEPVEPSLGVEANDLRLTGEMPVASVEGAGGVLLDREPEPVGHPSVPQLGRTAQTDAEARAEPSGTATKVKKARRKKAKKKAKKKAVKKTAKKKAKKKAGKKKATRKAKKKGKKKPK